MRRLLLSALLCSISAGSPTEAWSESAPSVAKEQAGAQEVQFEFVLSEDSELTSGGVCDADGKLVRTLWTMEARAAGRHTANWDGLDELGQAPPKGQYHLRVVVNGSTYRNVGTLGNTGSPPGEPQHIQHSVISVALDTKGNIYTANGWEEAGHDFKVQSPDGQTLFHARYQIRNGNPNGAPHAIAVDETHIYCATHGWANDQWKSKQQIQRFRIDTGDHETFTDSSLADSAGHIQLYEWPEKQIPPDTDRTDAKLMEKPVRALAVCGQTIFATDCLGNKVLKFHKVTGTLEGSFTVNLPHAIAIDSRSRLWVGHEHHKVTVFDTGGKRLGITMENLGEIRSLSFSADGKLILADGNAGQVRFYNVEQNPPALARTFGRKASPGDRDPDCFDELRGAAVDSDGNLVTIATISTGGARIARFAPDGNCLWEHMALAFCDVGSYSAKRPGELITQRFHKLLLTDKSTGEWEYRGSALDGDPKYLWGNHGVMRFVELGGNEFLYQCYGDGMQVYRRYGEFYRLAGMVGGNEPWPDGRFNHDLPEPERKPTGLWSWTDRNANGEVEQEEVVWFKQPGQARYALFGMNADRQGTLIYCEHHTHGIWELPLAKVDSNGNPVYDWDLTRQIVSADTSPAKLDPLMAVRSEDGSLYAMGRSEAFERPGGTEAGWIWMGGWALARYNKDNERLWVTRLPEVCPGMCDIPGGRGVMLGYFKLGHVYHYEPGGLLIGVAKLGDAAGNQTGWMDNTAALAVARDPRDGILDVFGEDSWLNRLIWYRVDDRDIQVVKGKPK